MTVGIDMAVSEITLVLFTTLAPSGTVAFLLMAGMSYSKHADDATRRRIDRHLYVPLVVTMAGLIMSATHLGNPSNVLYVFGRTGSSPLSNEVAGAVVFLGLAGVYWLYLSSRKPKRALCRVWFALICLTGVAFVTLIALAYAADTIISWNTPFVPVNLWLSALVGGPVLALASLRFAGADFVRARTAWVFVAVSAVSLVANAVCLAVQRTTFSGISNELSTVADLVPFYGLFIVGFVVLAALGVVLVAVNLRRGAPFKTAAARRLLAVDATACVLVFAGIFLTRFAFYAMHMTLGLGM